MDRVVISEPANTDASTAEAGPARWRLDAAVAQLFAWVALGLLNQVLIAIRLPSPLPGVGIWHRASDFGQFLLLGGLSHVAVRLGAAGLARAPSTSKLRPFYPALLVFALAGGLSLLGVGPDLANLAQRSELETWQLTVPVSIVFGVALAATLGLRRWARGSLRGVFCLVALGLATSNAFVLETDYFFVHFMLAWLSAQLAAHAIEGLELPALPLAAHRIGTTAVAVIGLLALTLPERSNEVQRRLFSLQSSVAPPLLARLMPGRSAAGQARVLPEYENSPWFSPRDAQPPAQPTRAVSLPEAPLVVLFTIDAMRADVLEVTKHKKRLPQLSRLQSESVSFSQARSPTPATTTTFGSIFSGKYYSMLPWEYLGKGKTRLIEKTPRFAQVLERAGVHTIQIVTLGRLNSNSGVGLGFVSEVALQRKQGAKDVVDLAIEQLNKAPAGPTFLFAHFTEAHAPYNQAGTKGSPVSRYVGELAIVDAEIGRFREYLQSVGRDKRTVFIISADHGEAFGEHGQNFHARSVYEELMHVPLLIHAPQLPRRRVDTPVTLMDLGPTILDLFGLPAPGSYMGQSIAPLLLGKPARLTRPIIADAGRQIQAFYFPDGKKVIFDRPKKTTEMYDLHADPAELTNLIEGQSAGTTAGYVQTAEAFFRGVRRAEQTGVAVND
jgi:hypothetical protein